MTKLKKSRSRNRLLRCESLETRQLLAVTVATEAELVAALDMDEECIELTADITLSGSQLIVDTETVIYGGGFTIDADGLSRVIYASGELTLNDITITGGAGVPQGAGILGSAPLTISRSTITGNAAIDPLGRFTGTGGGIQAFAPLTITDSTISGNTAAAIGDIPTTDPPGDYYFTGIGGGIYAFNTSVTLTNVDVTANEASNSGGGAAIYGSGPHVIDRSEFTNNRIGNQASQTTPGTNVRGGGLLIQGLQPGLDATITNTLVDGNMGGQTAAVDDISFDYGIGMFVRTLAAGDQVMLDNVTISNNIQTTDSVIVGELSVQRGTGLAMTAFDGGRFEINRSTITGNQMSPNGNFRGYGGGVSFATFNSYGNDNPQPGIFNLNATDITNNVGVRGGGIGTGYQGGYLDDGYGAKSRITIDGGSITGNTAIGDGGGASWAWIASETRIKNSVVSDNFTPGHGGAFYTSKAFTEYGAYSTSDLFVEDSTIADNLAGGTGGAFHFSNPGLSAFYQDLATARIANSTISGNSAANGGGIYAYDTDVEVFQVTGSGNQSGGNGGFMTNRTFFGFVGTDKQAAFELNRSTIAFNTATGGGGGVYSDYYSTMSIANSIITQNISGTNAGSDLYASSPVGGANFSMDYSLISNSSGANLSGGDGNLLNFTALLGPLANNGGRTLTHLPGIGSPAIDRADPGSGGGAFDRDQREAMPRNFDGDLDGTNRMDMGSVEVGATLPSPEDFNDDGLADCDDLNMLSRAVADGDLAFDINEDGIMNGDDINVWLALAGARPEYADATNGNPFLLGDSDLDGLVDALDFINWNAFKFESVDGSPSGPQGYCDGDFNGDNTVDGLDFIIWNDNKFTDASDPPPPIVDDGGGLERDLVQTWHERMKVSRQPSSLARSIPGQAERLGRSTWHNDRLATPTPGVTRDAPEFLAPFEAPSTPSQVSTANGMSALERFFSELGRAEDTKSVSRGFDFL